MRSLNLVWSTALAAASCASPSYAAPDVPPPKTDLPAPANAKEMRTAVFAGGCFWCVEAVFEQLEGVSEVVSGYAGGGADDAKYPVVSSGRTKHAEAVRVTYDPAKISYGKLLQVLFYTSEPTVLDRQGPDHGHQYRMAVFVANEDERRVVKAYIDQLEAAKIFPQKIVTTIEPLTAFYPAEEYHQDFVRLNPNHGYVRQWSVPKVTKLVSKFPELLKKKS